MATEAATYLVANWAVERFPNADDEVEVFETESETVWSSSRSRVEVLG
jgi:hypothetical protein